MLDLIDKYYDALDAPKKGGEKVSITAFLDCWINTWKGSEIVCFTLS